MVLVLGSLYSLLPTLTASGSRTVGVSRDARRCLRRLVCTCVCRESQCAAPLCESLGGAALKSAS